MDVSVLIGKPLGAMRPSPPIIAWEEVNMRMHKTSVVRGPDRSLYPTTVIRSPRDASLRV